MHEKAKFVCFNYMQPQKVKFKSVKINMKQVSYVLPIFFSQKTDVLSGIYLNTLKHNVWRTKLETNGLHLHSIWVWNSSLFLLISTLSITFGCNL